VISQQLSLFPEQAKLHRTYGRGLTAIVNAKGVLDVDTVKGCAFGMAAYPGRGCYGDCYAARIARYRGFDFETSVLRKFSDREHVATIRNIIADHSDMWYRIGVHGDPSYDWHHTVGVCKYLWPTGKVPVIVTKHWTVLSDSQMGFLAKLGAIVHTSISGMDTDAEIEHRLIQAARASDAGCKSIRRVVTCDFGNSAWAVDCATKQRALLSTGMVIDNPFRPSKSNPRYIAGDVRAITRDDSIGGRHVSLHSDNAYLGHCSTCLDQCGMNMNYKEVDNVKR
jgi:hypothetical protein